MAHLDKRKLLWGAVASGAILLLGVAALVYRTVSDDDPDPAADVDPGTPVTRPDGTTSSSDSETTGNPTTGNPAVPLAEVTLSTTEIGEFDTPISLVSRTGDPSLYVAERDGRVRRVAVEGEGSDRTYTAEDEPLLDISDEVTTEGERGLLDITFSPDGARLYLSYSQAPEGTSKVISYSYDGNAVDEGSRREILSIDDFRPNHNGGDVEFGPDGFLYFAMGDGGGSGDPQQTSQDTSRLLGKVMRIDPEGAAGDEPYLIPGDNPFADGSGGQPEIWLYGVRNPWRITFDAANGDLWIADVGQGAWEEIDYFAASAGSGRGANLGWSEMEGAHPFEGGANPPDGVLPVFEYPYGDAGCAIVGGVVYRGSANPGLDGAYLFGDFCMSRLRAIRQNGGAVVDEVTFDAQVAGLVSFGQDNGGAVYAVSLDGPIYRLDP